MLSGCQTYRSTYCFSYHEIDESDDFSPFSSDDDLNKLVDVYIAWSSYIMKTAIKHFPVRHHEIFKCDEAFLAGVLMTLSSETKLYSMIEGDEEEESKIYWLQHYSSKLPTLAKALQDAGYPITTCHYLRDLHDRDASPEPALSHGRKFDYGEYIKYMVRTFVISMVDNYRLVVRQFIRQWHQIAKNPMIAKKLEMVEIPLEVKCLKPVQQMIYTPLTEQHLEQFDDATSDREDTQITYRCAVYAWIDHMYEIWLEDEKAMNKKLTHRSFAISLIEGRHIEQFPRFVSQYFQSIGFDRQDFKMFTNIPEYEDLKQIDEDLKQIEEDNRDDNLCFVYGDFITFIASEMYPPFDQPITKDHPRWPIVELACNCFVDNCRWLYSQNSEYIDEVYDEQETIYNNNMAKEMAEYQRNFEQYGAPSVVPRDLRNFHEELMAKKYGVKEQIVPERTAEEYQQAKRDQKAWCDEHDADDEEVNSATQEDIETQEKFLESCMGDARWEAQELEASQDPMMEKKTAAVIAAKEKVLAVQATIEPTPQKSVYSFVDVPRFEEIRLQGPVYDEMFSEMPYHQIPIIYKITKHKRADSCNYSNPECQFIGEWFRCLAANYHQKYCGTDGDTKFPGCCQRSLFNHALCSLTVLFDCVINNCKLDHVPLVYRFNPKMATNDTFTSPIREITNQLVNKRWHWFDDAISRFHKLLFHINKKEDAYVKLYGPIKTSMYISPEYDEEKVKAHHTLIKGVYKVPASQVIQPDLQSLKTIKMETEKLNDYKHWLLDVATNIVEMRRISETCYSKRPALRSPEALRLSDLIQKVLPEAAQRVVPDHDALLEKIQEIFPHLHTMDEELYNLMMMNLRSLFVVGSWKNMVSEIREYEDALKAHMRGYGMDFHSEALRIGYDRYAPAVDREEKDSDEVKDSDVLKSIERDMRLYTAKEIYEWEPILLPEVGIVTMKDLLEKIGGITKNRGIQAALLVEALSERVESIKVYIENQKRQLFVDIHNNMYIQTGEFKSVRSKQRKTQIRFDIARTIIAFLKQHYDALTEYGATPLTDEELINEKYATELLEIYRDFEDQDLRLQYRMTSMTIGGPGASEALEAYRRYYIKNAVPQTKKIEGFFFNHALILTQAIQRAVLELNPEVKMPALVKEPKVKNEKASAAAGKKKDPEPSMVQITGRNKTTYKQTRTRLGTTRLRDIDMGLLDRATNALTKKSFAEYDLKASDPDKILTAISDQLREFKGRKKIPIEQLDRFADLVEFAREKFQEDYKKIDKPKEIPKPIEVHQPIVPGPSRAAILGYKDIKIQEPKEAPVEIVQALRKPIEDIKVPVPVNVECHPRSINEGRKRIQTIRDQEAKTEKSRRKHEILAENFNQLAKSVERSRTHRSINPTPQKRKPVILSDVVQVRMRELEKLNKQRLEADAPSQKNKSRQIRSFK
ncbi:Hypothetical protein POVR1_LOCUS81 [uncultured virus]|nr:Hypothetical protein POVR1_LOCUS81 [uncultured virus]